MYGHSIMAARLARKGLADHRAMEEEAERYNPVNPKEKLGARKGRTTLVAVGDEYTGMGATPSAGVSQFRGGASPDEPGEHLVGSGKLVIHHGGRKAKAKAKKHSEAHEMGEHLGKHLHSLHGSGFFDDFKSGFNSVFAPVAGIVKSIAPLAGPEGMAASGVLGALGYGKMRGCGKAKRGGRNTTFPGGAAVSATELEGSGLLGQDGHGQRQVGSGHGDQFFDDGMAGCGDDYDGGMAGCGSTGAGKGGRAARAAIVKKVMADRGVKMIEASKIVKAEGLY
jgi:hypothetical protein